ncbi:MAG: hypothetical protein A2V88_02695 [Elusimicrobia bacterium RBG_16_66_12]|nr:MAG: hypothetical protein A2V88_02695 [Elusimicrobia bacterium RBG_16_66_12]
MAAKTWYVTNTIVGSTHQEMSESSPGSDATSSPNYGWTVGASAAGTYCRADAGSEITGFAASPIEPDGSIVTTANAGDCWRSANAMTGTFDTGTWLFQMAVIAVTAGGQMDGNAGFRLFKGKAANGSDAVEITSGRLVGSTVTNLATSAQQNSIHNSTSIPGFSVDGEYIFVQVGWEITGAGAMLHDCIHRIGTTASLVTSPNFSATTPQSMSATEAAALALAAVVTFARSLAATATGAASLIAQAVAGRSLAASAASVADVARAVTFARVAAATAATAATVAWALDLRRAAGAVLEGVAVLGRIASFPRTLTAATVSIASLVAARLSTATLSASAGSAASMALAVTATPPPLPVVFGPFMRGELWWSRRVGGF